MLSILSQKKKCVKCGEWKDESEFYKRKNRRAELSCKKCELETNREYYHANKSFVSKIRYLWQSSNRDRLNEYRKINKSKGNVSLQRKNRRAREKMAIGVITSSEWEGLKKKYNYTCLRCKRREPEVKLTLDHVMPLSLGGSNTIDNAQCLCNSCNASKNARYIDYRY